MTPGSLSILVYHSISDDASARFRPYAIARTCFEDHVALLRELRYVTLTLSDAAAHLYDGNPLPERSVVLTFDDAFADFAEIAAPVLGEAGFVATLFVPTAFVGSTSRWLAREGEDGRHIMAWSDIRDAADAGVEIGAHSHSHRELDRLSAPKLQTELRLSKALLEDELGRKVTAVAYPFGFHSSRVRRAARAAGYDYGCAVGNLTAERRCSRWAIPRLTVKDTTSVSALRRLLMHESTFFDRKVSETKRTVWYARRVLGSR